MSSIYTDAFSRGKYIYLRGWNDGKRVHRKVEYQPYLFVDAKNKEAEYQSLYKNPACRMDFDNLYEAKDFLKKYSGVSGMNIYGLDKFVYTFLNDYYPGELSWSSSDLNIGNIDIETDSSDGFPDIQAADKEIISITLKCRSIYMFGFVDYTPPDNVIYVKCKDERDLLYKFLSVWQSLDLDVITGWNIEFFDIPYIVKRIIQVLGEDAAKSLSPWGILTDHQVEIFNKPQTVYVPAGICVLDYLQLYKKFTYKAQESYRLDHIAKVELDERKLDYSEYGTLNELYQKNPQKFLDYNLHDVIIVDRLDEKMKLIDLALTVAYDAKINISDVFTSVRLWDTLIHNHMMQTKRVVSSFTPARKQEFVGAYVKDPIPGMHKYVASFDYESLYPSLIVQYNISPETYRGKITDHFDVDWKINDYLNGCMNDHKIQNFLKKHNYALTANGCLWDRAQEGVFPEIIRKMMSERKEYKKKMLDAKKEYEQTKNEELKKVISKYENLQMARKIQLNSLYGSLGNVYFRWFNLDFAEAITLTGQLSIMWVEKHINLFLNKLSGTQKDRCIAIDTDSTYFNLSDIIPANYSQDKWLDTLDKICKNVLEPKINDVNLKLADGLNASTPFLRMKREALARQGIWIKKKRYILEIFDNEGVRYAEPEIKIMGHEAVKSSTPEVCRNKLKESFKVIFNGTEDDVIDFVDTFREEFYNLSFDSVASPSSVNGISEYSHPTLLYSSGTPMHVKGAIVYNAYLKQHGLDKKYDPIRDGNKIRCCYMKLPNPVREKCLSVPSSLPPELNLEKYIDYATQFEKTFISPLKVILDLIEYKIERVNTLEGFFS